MIWQKIVAGRGGSMNNGIGTRHGKAGIVFFFLLACVAFALWAPNVNAQSNYYVDRGCSGCHGATPTTCNGCHEHGVIGRTGSPQSATVNKTTFAPGEDVIVTLRGGRTSSATNGVGGWVRGILYRDNVEISRSAGTVAPGNIGPSGGSGLPITFTTAAPTTPGTYTYAAAWFGNLNNSGSTHGEVRAPAITITVAAASAAGPMTVSPAGGLTSSGIAGGPFTPLSQIYTLTNTGAASMNWTASKVASWVTLSAAGGTLAAGANTTVTASINSGANSLAVGSYSDNVTFTNTTSGTGNTTRPVSLTVNAANVAGPMTVSPAGGLTSSGIAGGPFTPLSQIYTLTNTGAASMNWTASKVASWVTLSAAGGTLAAGANTTVTASINSGANSLAVGSYSDNVTFTNTTSGTGNTTRPVSLTVNAAEAPTISTVSLPAGALNTAYSQTLAATGGTTPYSWSVSAGTLPAGLSLSATGVLDGMPTAEGISSFTVRVAGANSASSTKDFSMTINAAATPPTVDLSSDSGGSCSVALRTGTGGSYIDGTLILAGLGMAVWGIRIRRRRG